MILIMLLRLSGTLAMLILTWIAYTSGLVCSARGAEMHLRGKGDGKPEIAHTFSL